MATHKLADTRTWLGASYKSAACEYIPWHTAGIELLQLQQINGCGSEQAVNGNCCMHMHKEINDGELSVHMQQANIIALKSGRGSRSERCSGSRRCASRSRFLDFASHVIQ